MFGRNKNKAVSQSKINSIVNKFVKEKEKNTLDRTHERLSSLLSRKDIIDSDNEKIDALRMLAFHIESNKEMSAASLVKFLKS